jgi:hypothetical protein
MKFIFIEREMRWTTILGKVRTLNHTILHLLGSVNWTSDWCLAYPIFSASTKICPAQFFVHWPADQNSSVEIEEVFCVGDTSELSPANVDADDICHTQSSPVDFH